ncbi:MAG: transporter substrate-binding domain-containing protein [Candidatus Competibacterales bacterium]|nr:transporter substrate-binding domain-containing protein [Candidatus Competibacterales bacterium]
MSRLLVLALLAMPAAAVELDRIRQDGVLRVAVYRDFPPYSYLRDGRTMGVDVDLARALAERLGVALSLMNLTADESMGDDLRNAIWKGHYLGGGTADLMLHVPVDAAFAAQNDQVAIFGPYYREEIVIAYDPEQIPVMNSLRVFLAQPVAVELETIADTVLTRAEGGQLVDNVIHYRRVGQACEGLRDGRVAAYMGPRAQLEHCLGGDERFAIASVPVRVGLFQWTVGLAVDADHTALRDALAQALETLRADGSLAAIYQAHGLSYQAPDSL